jgi:hypothetical protein
MSRAPSRPQTNRGPGNRAMRQTTSPQRTSEAQEEPPASNRLPSASKNADVISQRTMMLNAKSERWRRTRNGRIGNAAPPGAICSAEILSAVILIHGCTGLQVGLPFHVFVLRFSNPFANPVTTAPRTNITSNPSPRSGGPDGRNQTFTAPTLKIGVRSIETRIWPSLNLPLRQELTKVTITNAAPTANQPLHNNRMRRSSFMRALLPPTVCSA